jgi:hypothetical protein
MPDTVQLAPPPDTGRKRERKKEETSSFTLNKQNHDVEQEWSILLSPLCTSLLSVTSCQPVPSVSFHLSSLLALT